MAEDEIELRREEREGRRDYGRMRRGSKVLVEKGM